MRTLIAASLALAALAGAARAEVADAQPNGFQIRETADIKAPPEAVWTAMVGLGQWWSAKHSFSGDAHNYRLEPRVGGCLCEGLPPDGAVEHLRVTYVRPGRELHLSGGLGPFSLVAATGAWIVKLDPAAGGTRVSWTYTAGGYMPGGFDKTAPMADAVMSEQLARLKRYVETGKPE
jgi:uncharacterized protein YndB with AHSA1/START domain